MTFAEACEALVAGSIVQRGAYRLRISDSFVQQNLAGFSRGWEDARHLGIDDLRATDWEIQPPQEHGTSSSSASAQPSVQDDKLITDGQKAGSTVEKGGEE